MNTNTMELNMNEMEMVNGGGLWDTIAGRAFEGGVLGLVAAGAVIIAVSNPVGMAAAAGIVAAGVAIGAAAGTGAGAVESYLTE